MKLRAEVVLQVAVVPEGTAAKLAIMVYLAPVVVQCVLRMKVLHIIVNSNLWRVGW